MSGYNREFLRFQDIESDIPIIKGGGLTAILSFMNLENSFFVLALIVELLLNFLDDSYIE